MNGSVGNGLDSDVALQPQTAAVAGPIQMAATSPLFASTDVGRQVTVRCQCPVRQPATAYAVGVVFYSSYDDTERVYRVTGAGTTAALKSAGTTPDFDQNAPYQTGDNIIDGTCRLLYVGAGEQAYGFGIITAYQTPLLVTVTVDPRGPFASTGASLRWALGTWSNAAGWPYCVTFYQQRLVFGGSASAPETLWFSQSGDFPNMGAIEPDGTVLDTNAIVEAMDDDQVNTIKWMTNIPRGLAVGTASGEFLVGPASTSSAALAPSNIRALRQTDRGSADMAGVRVSGIALFVQRGALKLRQLQYEFVTDSFSTDDMTELSDHIAGPGWVEVAYKDLRDGTFWLLRSDGVLSTLTYDRDQKVRAWARHVIGGQNAVVESICTIPSPDGTNDDLWMSVARTIGGATVRSIEYIRQPFRSDLDGVNGGFFVDCGLTYSGEPATVFSGLDYLEGQTVAICADGAARPPQVVIQGTVTIKGPAASLVFIGLPYTSTLETLPLELPAGGSSIDKIKSVGDVTLRFFETRGGVFGSLTRQQRLQMRPRAANMSQAIPLWNDDYRMPFPGGNDRQQHMLLIQDQPLPMTLLAIEADVTVHDP